MLKMANRVLAVAFVAAGLGLLANDTKEEPRPRQELINRPLNPFICRTDEGYERWTACDGAHRSKASDAPIEH